MGNSRRNNITTAEFRENRSYVPVYLLENLRLVNQAGTAENRVSHDKKKRLKAWNSKSFVDFPRALVNTYPA